MCGKGISVGAVREPPLLTRISHQQARGEGGKACHPERKRRTFRIRSGGIPRPRITGCSGSPRMGATGP